MQPFPTEPGVSEALASAHKRKREWEEESQDDVSVSALTIGDIPSSVGSTATKRRKVWRRNQKASVRTQAKHNMRPSFTHITVLDGGFFHRHVKKEWLFAEPDPFVVEYLALHGPPTPEFNPEEYSFMLPCDPAQMAHLAYFDREPATRPADHHGAYTHACRKVEAILSLDNKLPFPHSEDLAEVPFKPGKFPGNEYRQLGFKTRQEAHLAALVDAELAWAQLMDDDHVPPHSVRLGGRGKLSHATAEQLRAGGIPKGRLILMLSQRDLLLLGVTEKLLTEAYKSERFPVSIGMGWYKGNVTSFFRRLQPLDQFFCMDAEKFDASLEPWLVDRAIAILRRQFIGGEDPRLDKYWDFVRESLLAAPIARDDGWVMHKMVGTTSGHSFNTLVQSICSLIVGYAALFELTPRARWGDLWEQVEMETLGDDNVTALPEWLAHITARDFGEAVKRATGINWLGRKSFRTTILEDGDWVGPDASEQGRFQGVQYLGKFLRAIDLGRHGGEGMAVIPYRPASESILRLYYPERRKMSVEQAYLRALGNLLDNYGNPLAATWLNGFLDWLEGKMDQPPIAWGEDTIQDAARDYTNKVVEAPKPRRWTFEEWLALTLSEGEGVEDLFCFS
ncbi:RNA-dependent RNA polymerase [viral metagenome]|uniref:RNA-dependent RNA polymerase n=1 Tax=viral metagenome TaxID=1070528 RepID=A0A6L2ZJC3_9ZZZZ